MLIGKSEVVGKLSKATFKESMKLNCNFWRVRGSNQKTIRGVYGYFLEPHNRIDI